METKLEDKAQKGKISLLNIVAFLAILGLITVGSYLKYQEVKANKEIQKLDQEITTLTEEIQKLEDEHISTVFIAQNGLNNLKEKEVLWSKFIRKILAITPENILYTSYSGGESRKITLSTLALSLDDTAKIIKILRSQPEFSEIFIPSVSKGETEQTDELVTFNINLNYEPASGEEKTKVKRQRPSAETTEEDTTEEKTGNNTEETENTREETENTREETEENTAK